VHRGGRGEGERVGQARDDGVRRLTAADRAHADRAWNGRLRAWEQETCTRSVPGTRAPDGWVPFLRRNAELAARLAALPVN
jgi:excinuclease ABC subunit C